MTVRSKFDEELEKIYAKVATMCRNVLRAIEKSVNTLVESDDGVAKRIVENDKNINCLEREIEQECFKVLLLENPFANDFRKISAAIKMVSDLERIGDNASDIASLSLKFKSKNKVFPKKLHNMAMLVIEMVKDSVNSYINGDYNLATSLDKKDDVVDEAFSDIKSEIIKSVQVDCESIEQGIHCLMIAKYLERISDHAVNIGEWVNYSLTGKLK